MLDGILSELPGKRKAAIFLACMGSDKASRIMSSLSDEEVEELTLSLSSLDSVDSNVRTAVIDEFYEMAVANKVVTQGGIDYARSLLEKAFGADRTIEILTRLQTNLQDVPFQFLKKADPGQVVTFIQDEHPQTISLILAHRPASTSAMVLSALSQDVQSDVVMRIATMERTPPEVVREVERVLERKMAAVFTQGFTFAGGVKDVAEILNNIDRAAEKTIMASLEESDPELADEIARLMFTFDDIVYVDDGGIQKALREVEWSTLFFFIGLFIVVGGLEQVGLLTEIGEWAAEVTGCSAAASAMLVLWMSAILSGFIGNIPYTATMLPIVETMSAQLDASAAPNLLWWSLAIGADMGGNLTIVAASANVLVANLATRNGLKISFLEFFRYGLVTTMITMLIASAYIWLRYLAF